MNLNPYEPPQVVTVYRVANTRPFVRGWMTYAGFFLVNLVVAYTFDEAYFTMIKSVSEPLTKYVLNGEVPRLEELVIMRGYIGYAVYLLSLLLIPCVAYWGYRLICFTCRMITAGKGV